jgi:hypothetical protein
VRIISPLMALTAILGLGAPMTSALPVAAASVKTTALLAGTLSITVPASASLGSASPGNTITSHLGTVTVIDGRTGSKSWTATVSATNFTASGGNTIARGSVSYWSGPVTVSSGTGIRTPGQPTAAGAVSLSAPVTGFSGSKTSLVSSTTTGWNPTLVVSVPSTATARTYTGVITHSVA